MEANDLRAQIDSLRDQLASAEYPIEVVEISVEATEAAKAASAERMNGVPALGDVTTHPTVAPGPEVPVVVSNWFDVTNLGTLLDVLA